MDATVDKATVDKATGMQIHRHTQSLYCILKQLNLNILYCTVVLFYATHLAHVSTTIHFLYK